MQAILNGQIMTFQEIAAIPALDDGKPRAAPSATTTTRPRTELLIRNDPPVGSLTDDNTIFYHAVQAGVIPDPAPHYLWMEADGLINWYKNELTKKLNGLLQADMQRRSEKKRLIKNIKFGTLKRGQHEDLIKWCRTGKHRQNIHFRLYDDWIARLSRFDFEQKDPSIIELMTLISDIYPGIYTNGIAGGPVPAFLTPANTGQSSLVPNHAQKHSATRGSTPFGTQPSRPTQPIAPARREIVPETFGPFEVYHARSYDDPHGVHQSYPSPFQDEMYLPARGTSASFPAYDQPASMSAGLIAAMMPQTHKHQADDGIEELDFELELSRNLSSQPSHQLDLVTDDIYSPEDFEDVELPNFSPDMLDFVTSLKKQEVLVILLRREVVPHEDLVGRDMCNVHLLPPPNTGAMNQWLDARLEPTEPKPQLFRDREESEANDFSQFARCVRFSKCPSQAKTDWRVHHDHVAELYKVSNRYRMELLRARSNLQHPLPGGGDSLQVPLRGVRRSHLRTL
jgi:hypothetical protein